jgi:hypothetical protein
VALIFLAFLCKSIFLTAVRLYAREWFTGWFAHALDYDDFLARHRDGTIMSMDDAFYAEFLFGTMWGNNGRSLGWGNGSRRCKEFCRVFTLVII